MGKLLHSKAAAGAAGALGVVEHEVLWLDVAIYESMSLAAKVSIKTILPSLGYTFRDVDLDDSVSYKECAGDTGFDGLFVLDAYKEAVHNGVHVDDLRFIKLDFSGDVDGLAVNDEDAAPFLADFGEHVVEVLSVLLEYWCPQFDFRAFRKREDRLENLAQ